MSRVLLISVFGTVLAACMPPDDPFIEQRSFAMATWVDVIFESTRNDATDAATISDIEVLLRDYETDFYAWADGELARINASIAAAEPIEVSDVMGDLLDRAKEISAKTGGRFDPGVGGLVELWGFHSAAETAATPEPQAIEAWLASAPSIGDISIDNQRVTAQNRSLKLDLGGIAKGAAVDSVIELLRGRGIGNALVNAGGDLRVIGTRSNRSWRIGIKSPRATGLLGYIELHSGEAAFTSGDYERFFDSDGIRMHHILDARTGYPANHTQAITVLASDGLTADAAATALFVAGPQDWRTLARQLQIESVLRVDASGEIEMTEAMRARLRPVTTSDESPIQGGS